MNLISSTKTESSSLGTSATKVWASNSSRVGIRIHASSGNSANLLVTAVPAGASAPTLSVATAMYELSPGQTLDGGNEFNGSVDLYVAMTTGSGAYNAYEVQN
ncbi:MAG: hypothetical protein GC165_07400 [Armatimonadetes bacterium]|nr:hypothetical protein [Armatimonadota bacterium]MBS1727365.1 hypothetical protein [Armatimonadota bacterium]